MATFPELSTGAASSSIQTDELEALQAHVLRHMATQIDTNSQALVFTDPRGDSPILYVTKRWEAMCGFSAKEAKGRNPRLTQGSGSDASVRSLIGRAIGNRRACKALMLNYRSGDETHPYWVMISISPIFVRGELLLYMASLQDYSHHLSLIKTLCPSQFCRSTEQHQCQCYLQRLHPERLSKPTVYEADLDTPLAQPIRTPAEAFVRRLGWDNLKLDPEHLEERCIDALRQMGADYQIIDAPASSTDHVIIRARLNDEVELNILIAEDFAEGTYRITCTRVAGIVTAYHAGLRALRDTIGLTRELQRTGLVRPSAAPHRPAVLHSSTAVS